ncbi:MAG: hypothetical protein LBG80_05990 [Bacteroidales bacterium]|nr:hypothetical protein [Bacteroidales bacterium]
MSVVYVEMKNVLKINAGIACLDRANEVLPRPNVRLSSFILHFLFY